MVIIEAFVAALLGLVLLWLVLYPLAHPADQWGAPAPEPIDVEETPKGIALAALKEIEFDRETGKLSDADYELLKAKYTTAALEALREENAEGAAPVSDGVAPVLSPAGAVCKVCGPRPEPDALFCSNCGLQLTRRVAA